MKNSFSSYILFGVYFSVCVPITLFSKSFENWVGLRPDEIIPSVKPLGSLAERYKEKEKEKTSSGPTGKSLFQEADKDKSSKPLFVKSSQDSEALNLSNENWVGLKPLQMIPQAIPLGSMKDRNFNKAFSYPLGFEKAEKSTEKLSSIPFNLSLFASSRIYQTNNVLRTRESELRSGVWENTGGFSLATKPLEVGRYVTLIPHLDFIMQWANYGEETVSDLLDYRFGMVLGNLDFYLPNDILIKAGLEYNFLHSQYTGDRLFDALAPSLSIEKIISLSDSTFLMIDTQLKYSRTERVLNFQAENVFPDDGDNLQANFNLNLIYLFGTEGQFMLMPGIGVSRSEYLKNAQDGRVDVMLYAGLSGTWQATDWMSLQLFSNYSQMFTNTLGKELLGLSAGYKALDIGGSITVQHSF